MKRRNRANTRNKLVALSLALALLLCGAIGGTLAWLTDDTNAVVNTFTVGNIDIDLTETTGTDYKMVPGATIGKDPKVTVEANSEACWLFVKVDEVDPVGYITNADGSNKTLKDTHKFGDFLTYSVDSAWASVPGAEGVYYKQVAASTTDQTWSVLTDDQVFVKDTVTKGMMDDLEMFVANDAECDTDNQYSPLPKLIFTAYAIQSANLKNGDTAVESAADAWAVISGT